MPRGRPKIKPKPDVMLSVRVPAELVAACTAAAAAAGVSRSAFVAALLRKGVEPQPAQPQDIAA